MFIISIHDVEMVGVCSFMFSSFVHSRKRAPGSGETLPWVGSALTWLLPDRDLGAWGQADLPLHLVAMLLPISV